MPQQHPVLFKAIGQMNPQVNYVERSAVRAILFDSATNKTAIIHVTKGNYYKLPGGGVEADEDHQLAAAREIMEEIGCKVEIADGKCLARCEEWRNDLHQISFCYVAKLTEDTGKPELTELEVSEGLTHRWMALEEALQAMKEIMPTSELGFFIKERDVFFLESFLSHKD